MTTARVNNDPRKKWTMAEYLFMAQGLMLGHKKLALKKEKDTLKNEIPMLRILRTKGL
jgi:hypothetical protein